MTVGRTPANYLDLKARPDLPATTDRQVKLVPTEKLVPQAIRGQLALPVRRAKPAMMELPVLPVLPEKLATMDRPAQQERTARLVLTAKQARLVRTVRLALREPTLW